MNETETKVLANIKDLCNYAPLHVDKWRIMLDPLLNKVKGISNMADQLRSVTNANIEFMENFKETQESLRYNIISCIEEDMKFVKETVEKISRTNAVFKDKLDKLESLSLVLDWDTEESELLQGSPLIPPLGRLLSHGLDFYTFFNKTYQNMQNLTRSIDWLEEKNMKMWEDAFIVDLDEDNVVVNYFLAVTQYADNEMILT